jgi:hypothetical protein
VNPPIRAVLRRRLTPDELAARWRRDGRWLDEVDRVTEAARRHPAPKRTVGMRLTQLLDRTLDAEARYRPATAAVAGGIAAGVQEAREAPIRTALLGAWQGLRTPPEVVAEAGQEKMRRALPLSYLSRIGRAP